jgi:hypothetical protein
MWMRVDVHMIVVSGLYLGGGLGGGSRTGPRLIDSSQPDSARLGAQIEQQWQELIKVCPLSRLCIHLCTLQELVVSNAALIVFGKIVALPPSASRLA